MHYMDGVAFAIVYALGLHPLLSKALRSTSAGNLLKGVLFGVILATISALSPVDFVTMKGPTPIVAGPRSAATIPERIIEL